MERCSAGRGSVASIDSAPRMLRGTLQRSGGISWSSHRRTRIVRPVHTLQIVRVRGDEGKSLIAQGQRGQALLRRPQGLRAAPRHQFEKKCRLCRVLRGCVRTIGLANGAADRRENVQLYDKGTSTYEQLFFRA